MSAEPITSASSRRRHNRSSPNNTWVPSQPRHRARRGRTRRSAPPATRTLRPRAQPHGASRSAQPGHRNRPANNSISTRTGSPLTMSTDASGITQEGPPRATAKKSEGVLARTNHPHADASAPPPPTPTAPAASSPPMTQSDPASSTTAASYSCRRCRRSSSHLHPSLMLGSVPAEAQTGRLSSSVRQPGVLPTSEWATLSSASSAKRGVLGGAQRH